VVVRRDDLGDPDVRRQRAAVFPERRRGGCQLRALVPFGRLRVGSRRAAGAACAMPPRDLRPASRVLATRRGTKTDVPRRSYVPASQELRLRAAAADCRCSHCGEDWFKVTQGHGGDARLQYAGGRLGAFVRLNRYAPLHSMWDAWGLETVSLCYDRLSADGP